MSNRFATKTTLIVTMTEHFMKDRSVDVKRSFRFVLNTAVFVVMLKLFAMTTKPGMTGTKLDSKKTSTPMINNLTSMTPLSTIGVPALQSVASTGAFAAFNTIRKTPTSLVVFMREAKARRGPNYIVMFILLVQLAAAGAKQLSDFLGTHRSRMPRQTIRDCRYA